MERLSGSAYCPNCKSQFDWVDTLLERGEVITTFKTELHKNISSTERLITGNGYSIMVICPECNYHFQVDDYNVMEL